MRHIITHTLIMAVKKRLTASDRNSNKQDGFLGKIATEKAKDAGERAFTASCVCDPLLHHQTVPPVSVLITPAMFLPL